MNDMVSSRKTGGLAEFGADSGIALKSSASRANCVCWIVDWSHGQAYWGASWHGGRGVQRRRAGARDRRQHFSDLFIEPAHVARAQGRSQASRADARTARQARRRPAGDPHQLPGQCMQPVRRGAREERRGLSWRDRAGAGAGRRVPRAPSRLVERAHARRRPQAGGRLHRSAPSTACRGRELRFHILIENTAGAEFSLGGSFEQVAELVERLEATRR